MKKRFLFLFVSLLTAFGAFEQNEAMLSTPLTLEAIEAGEITFGNKAAGVDWPTGKSGIPEGWTVVDYDPTGITTAAAAKTTSGRIYNLKGMRTPVNTKGLRIENGRKIVELQFPI